MSVRYGPDGAMMSVQQDYRMTQHQSQSREQAVVADRHDPNRRTLTEAPRPNADYKAKWCHFQWRQTHNCRFGARCVFAHSLDEYRGPPDWYTANWSARDERLAPPINISRSLLTSVNVILLSHWLPLRYLAV